MYILEYFSLFGYKLYSLNVLINTKATKNNCRPNAISTEKLVSIKHPILVKGIDG